MSPLVQTRPVTEVVADAVTAQAGQPGPLLAVLHEIVAAFGYVPVEAVGPLAAQLNLSRAEVHGVISFYSDLRTTPPGRTVVQICRAEACQAVGAEALMHETGHRLGVQPETTRGDGAVTLDGVFCFGNCALGPAAMVNGRLLGRVTADRLASLVEGAR